MFELTNQPPDVGPGTCDFTKYRYVLGFDSEAIAFPRAPHPDPKKAGFTRNPVTRLICTSWSGRTADPIPDPILRADRRNTGILQRGAKGWSALLGRADSKAMLDWVFQRQDVLLVAHNAAFDAMLALHTRRNVPETVTGIFRAYAQGRVVDTRLREQLLSIAEGWTEFDPVLSQKPPRFDLASCTQRRLGVTLGGKSGEDAWRLNYHKLDGVPLLQWPAEAVQYALLDAEYALYVALAQAPLGYRTRSSSDLPPYTTPQGGVVDETRQARAAFALELQSAWGVTTDPVTVAEWGDEIEEALVDATIAIQRIGVLRQAGDTYRTGAKAGKLVSKADIGTKDTGHLGALVEADLRAQGLPVPRTPTGKVQTGADVLLLCTMPELRKWGEAAHYEKWRSTYLTPAKVGTEGILPYKYNPLIDTGRTSSFNANAQNPPTKGRFRECVRARPNKVLCSIDFDAAELKGLGCIHYWIYGVSVYRDMSARGIDLHAPLAAMLWGKSLEEYLGIYNNKAHPLYSTAKTIYRQLAKAGNFGGWGGLGPVKFAGVAEDQYDVDLVAIAEVTGDAAVFREEYARYVADPAQAPRRLLPASVTKGGWGIAYLDPETDTVVVPNTPTLEAQYIRFSFARKLLQILRTVAIPEGGQYLQDVGELVRRAGGAEEDDRTAEEGGNDRGFTYVQFVSGRQRARCNYTNGANTGFQGIVADGAKEALWRVAVACYVQPEDACDILWAGNDDGVTYWNNIKGREDLLEVCRALYGVRPVLFIHDEIISEGDEETAHIWAPAMARLMCDAMEMFLRDVNVTASPALMRVWDKRAEPVYKEGKLVIWEPS